MAKTQGFRDIPAKEWEGPSKIVVRDLMQEVAGQPKLSADKMVKPKVTKVPDQGNYGPYDDVDYGEAEPKPSKAEKDA